MNRSWCERESNVVEALRRDAFSDELRDHVGSCTICAETQRVAQVLLQTASRLRAEHEPSAVGLVWRRAQVRKKELALKRATRPLIFMRVLSVVYVALFAGWSLHYFGRPKFMELPYGWNVLVNECACFGVAIAVLAVAIGVWFLLHDGRRSGEVLRST
jgi:hypothetical protein